MQTMSVNDLLGSGLKGLRCVANVIGDDGWGVLRMRAVTMREKGVVDSGSKVREEVVRVIPIVTVGVLDLRFYQRIAVKKRVFKRK